MRTAGVGAHEKLLTILEGRRSAVCIINKERKPELIIRWRRRKHQPPGPILRRSCTCTSTQQSPWCVVHRLEGWVKALGIKTGKRLWEIRPGQLLTAQKALSMLKRCLLLLGHKKVNTYSWKSVRSGGATEMAASGCTLGQILGAGKWRSAAFYGTSMRQVQTICNCYAQHLTRVTMNEKWIQENDTAACHVVGFF